MKISELLNENDPLGSFINQHNLAGPVEQSAAKFSSALGPDEDDDIAKIARGIMPPIQASATPVKQPQAKPTELPKSTELPKQAAATSVAKPQPPKAPPPPPVINQAPGSVPWTAIAQYLKNRWKMDKPHIAGMLANIEHESQFIPSTLVKDSNGLWSGGLFQHNGPRLQELVNKLGNNWKQNWQGQIEFALNEPIGKQYVTSQFTDPVKASQWWTTKWERPAHASVQAAKRAKSTSKYKV